LEWGEAGSAPPISKDAGSGMIRGRLAGTGALRAATRNMRLACLWLLGRNGLS